MTEAIFGSSKSEKINQFLILIKDREVQLIFRMYIENIRNIATSKLNILKRLAATEKLLGLNDYSIEDDGAKSIIPKQISLLTSQIKAIIKTNNKQSIMEPIPKSIHIGMSKTTAWAILLLFRDVIEVAIEGKDQIVIGSREINNYLTNHIQSGYRWGCK